MYAQKYVCHITGGGAVAALVILGIFVLLVALALAVPVRARLSYDRGELSAWAAYGPLRFQLYPRPPETEKAKAKRARQAEKQAAREAKQAKKAEQATQKAAEKQKSAEAEEGSVDAPEAPESQPDAEEKKKFSINADQIRYSLETLPHILSRALRRTGRSIRLEPLKIHLLVAGPDPAGTAELYGKLEAALGAGLPALHRLVRIEDQDIRLFLDFQAEEMDCIADVGIALRPGGLAGIGLQAGGSLLKWLIGFKKLASPAGDGKKKTKAA